MSPPLCGLCAHHTLLGFGPEHVLMVFADASTGAGAGLARAGHRPGRAAAAARRRRRRRGGGYAGGGGRGGGGRDGGGGDAEPGGLGGGPRPHAQQAGHQAAHPRVHALQRRLRPAA